MSLDPVKFEIYAVGGYVRDRLLGRDPKDHDYVVVGATAKDMVDAGFEPIEASFPVFLHPKTRDEFALARKERKVGVGYLGFEVFFDPTVTIEDDLYRRDLTVNAMARRVIGWNELGHAKLSDEIVDPFGGQQDLKDGVLRHVSEAFAEDPVRVLRAARFAARYEFDVHPETIELMAKVAPELDHVPQERIWAEFEKGLMENSPDIMVKCLHECMAMCTEALRPYVAADTFMMRFIQPSTPMYVRAALLMNGFYDTDYEPCRIPTEYARISKAVNKHGDKLWYYVKSSKEDRLSILELFRALNDTTFINQCIDVLSVHLTGITSEPAVRRQVRWDVDRISKVDATAIAAACKTGLDVKRKLFEARVAAM